MKEFSTGPRSERDSRPFPAAAGKRGWPWTCEETFLPGQQPRNNWPRISVVTPSFNQGHFIEETIRSVLLQDYPNLEYIIIDDGSTDNSFEIIRKYEPWLAYCVSGKNCGQSHVINQGFARASGDILAWLNSDDVFARGALHKVAGALCDRRMAMAIGDAIGTHGPDSLAGWLDRRRPNFAAMAYYIRTLPQPSVFWTKDLWHAAGQLREDLFFMMDNDLWLRMVPAARSISYIDSVLSYERTQPQQGTNSNHPRRQEYLRLRVKVPLQAARARGETTLGWLARVWYFWLRQRRGRFWHLLKPGFHWEALRGVFRRW
jgi:glycosyltransferase involved in cell wall biosynthesis